MCLLENGKFEANAILKRKREYGIGQMQTAFDDDLKELPKSESI